MSVLDLGGNKERNPCKKFIRYSGGSGKFTYWDGENNQDIDLSKGFHFLAEMGCISGFDEKSNSGIWSNELYMTQGEFHVRSKGGVIAQGKYQEIKDQVNAAGGKFTASVYALLDGEVVNIRLSGAGLGGWIGRPEQGSAYKLADLKPEKKGATNYFVPVFEIADLPVDGVAEKAKPVKEYLEAIIKAEKKTEPAPATPALPEMPPKTEQPGFSEDLPFS